MTYERTDNLSTPRSLLSAMLRGFARHCPECGKGSIFGGYLSVNPTCPSCGLKLEGHRADDAPPYFTILIVGHIIVPGMLLFEQLRHPPEWQHMIIWLPLTLVLCLTLLPRIKGSLIGLQWAQRMHGFGSEPY